MRSPMFLAAAALLCFAAAYGQNGGTIERSSSQLYDDDYNQLRVNEIRMWMSNNGETSHSRLTDGSGLEWPAGSGKHVIFSEGCVVGGHVRGALRIGGATYRAGLQAGPIMASGVAADPSNPMHRVYRVCRLNRTQFNLLTSAEQQELRADFMQWPVTVGAPWIDADSDSAYMPDFDAWLDGTGNTDAPDFPGTEALWYVANDLNPSRTQYLFGTPPMGLEFQVLAWAASGSDAEDRTVIIRYTIINKGSDDITDFHIARWVDPDIGNASDDLVGVDTTLEMMFAYNGASVDAIYGAEPPAVGIVWLQTPMVPAPGCVARYGNDWRAGYRNLPLRAFAYYINGDSVYSDPNLGTVNGAVQMFNYLQGRLWDGRPYIDPYSGMEITFPIAGDPLRRDGWIDGQIHVPGDRRMLSSCGPITFAPGDTQQVLLATVIGVGASPEQARQDARHIAHGLKRQYRYGVAPLELADASYDLQWPHRDEYALTISATCSPQQETVALLRDAAGQEFHRIHLFDDGQHGDGASDDGRYAATSVRGVRSSGCDLYIATLRSDTVTAETMIGSMLPLVGEVSLSDFAVISDHMDFNQEAAPEENVVLSCALENHSRYTLGPWLIDIRIPPNIGKSGTIARAVPEGSTQAIDGLQAGLESALIFDVPAEAQPGSVLLLPVTLVSRQYCMWFDTLMLPVHALSRPMVAGMLEHTAGPGLGTLAYTVADPSVLNDHVYKVTVQGEDFGNKTLTIEDMTEGRILHSGVEAQDAHGHRSPSIAGVRLRLGSAYTGLESKPNGPMQILPVLWEFDHPERPWFRLSSALLYGYQSPGSTLTIFDSYPVSLVFDAVNGQKAYGYAGSSEWNAPYQGFFDIPVRAYDMRKPEQPGQIDLMFLEYSGGAANDRRWFPTTNSIDREYLCVLGARYTGYPDPAYSLSYDAPFFPRLYTVRPMLDASSPMFEDGDRFLITPQVPISSRDEYLLDMRTITAMDRTPVGPETIALYPNYPNPFTGVTNIAYSIESPGFVELAVVDMLGRKVRTLAAGYEEPGTHVRKLQLLDAPAGMYLCRLTVGETVRTKSLLLLR
jgi:hypothetical protein